MLSLSAAGECGSSMWKKWALLPLLQSAGVAVCSDGRAPGAAATLAQSHLPVTCPLCVEMKSVWGTHLNQETLAIPFPFRLVLPGKQFCMLFPRLPFGFTSAGKSVHLLHPSVQSRSRGQGSLSHRAGVVGRCQQESHGSLRCVPNPLWGPSCVTAGAARLRLLCQHPWAAVLCRRG